ncbi:phage integrase [Halopseudomonas litoralis]|uniref:phage integrase n=1 Tax=Halopseudomonas litoralis TaxID=797277 RepID=UPI000B2B6B49|nr:tyrosine-type recombinase/integrase [Halopseudomonas litoralis]
MTARKDGKAWTADFYVDGRRIRRHGFATKSAALRYQQDYQEQMTVTGRPLDDRLSDLIQVWYDLHGQTLKDHKTRLTRTLSIAERMGNPLASEFTALSWARYRAARLSEVSPATVNHEQRYLSAVFSELIRLGAWHGVNPLDGVRQIKVDDVELSFLELDQVQQLLGECLQSQNNHTYPVALICLATGARWGEAETLTRSQFAQGKIHFHRTKNGKSRSVPVPQAVIDAAFKNALPGTRLFTSCRAAFRGAYERCGFDTPGQLTHILRHTFASHFMMGGGDILTLQRILGHGDIKMTMRYAHLSPDHLSQAVELSPLAQLAAGI